MCAKNNAKNYRLGVTQTLMKLLITNYTSWHCNWIVNSMGCILKDPQLQIIKFVKIILYYP